MSNYFPKFQESLARKRVLKTCNYARFLREAPMEIVGADSPELPSIVYEEGDVTYFKTSSFARAPGGETVKCIEELLRNRLPPDFREFYTLYSEALVVTRSYPIHLWSMARIVEWFGDMRYEKPYPLRFIRFGDYWDLGSTQFAIWQKDPFRNDWYVVTTSVGQHDDQYDESGFSDYYKVGDSFAGWLEDWVARDGLPDPFMKLGSDGGFLDPA